MQYRLITICVKNVMNGKKPAATESVEAPAESTSQDQQLNS